MKGQNAESLVQLGLASQVSRRQAMQWVMAAVAASALPTAAGAQEVGRTVTPQEHASSQPARNGQGYGVDPNLVKTYKPGELWPLTFSPEQKKTFTALADAIIPSDNLGPAASAVGVPEMIDEWISAPYPQQHGDRPIILEGLKWLETESNKRFSKSFADLSEAQYRKIGDDICHAPSAKPEFQQGAHFFARVRSLCASAYYATPAGWKAIGYVGNTPLERFEGPPAEVLEKLGLTQTVK